MCFDVVLKATEMLHQKKAFVTKPDNLSSIPMVHMIEREDQLWQIAL